MADPMFTSVVERQEFTVGRLISRSLSVWWSNALRFLGLLVLAYVPIAAAGASAAVGVAASGRPPGEAFAGGLAAFLVPMLVGGAFTAFLALAAVGAMTYGSIQQLAGERVRFGALLSMGVRRALPVFGVGFLTGLAVLGGFMLLVVPGIIVMVGLWVAIPVAVVERNGVVAALGRSWQLTSGRRLPLFAAILVTMAISQVVSLASQGVAQAMPQGIAMIVAMAVAVAVNLLVSTLPLVVPAVAYHDLRVEKEGVDTASLVRVFE